MPLDLRLSQKTMKDKN